MPTVNMLDAKTNLSRLVDAVESGAEKEIVIARNGKPAARLVPMGKPDVSRRIGIAKGMKLPDWVNDLDLSRKLDDQIQKDFETGATKTRQAMARKPKKRK